MRQLSKEELSGKIEGFSEVFKLKTSKDLNLNHLREYLEDTLQVKEAQLIEQAFFGLSYEEIKTVLELLKEKRKK